jgi:hypothetical protein
VEEQLPLADHAEQAAHEAVTDFEKNDVEVVSNDTHVLDDGDDEELDEEDDDDTYF